jgi:hypothetical protein
VDSKVMMEVPLPDVNQAQQQKVGRGRGGMDGGQKMDGEGAAPGAAVRGVCRVPPSACVLALPLY